MSSRTWSGIHDCELEIFYLKYIPYSFNYPDIHMQKIIWTKKLIRNICQLILWAIMLVMSYSYVNAHDAEKTNFISGLSVLKQKIHSTYQSITWKGNTTDSARQQDMIRNYKELASYLEQSKCEISIPLSQVQERLTTLNVMTASEYKNQALSYSSFASQVYTEMQEKCKK